ncbi:MAG: NAD(P)-dependent oxidoreductase [Betaproteobacteria bacterium]|nr:NAD(P)-dependent oxidoreductase [Betaproteobacteria bacterium]
MSSDDGKKAMTPQARIGFIGLGLMGGGMAMNILKKHGQLNVCDLDERALAPLLEAGALRMDSPRALGEASDIVLTSLPDPAISKRVVLGAEGLIEGLAAGSTVIGMSTDGIETVREIQAALAARQIRFVDCPVGKGPTAAVAGELQLFAAGDRETCDSLRWLLSMIGSKIDYCGPIGAGQAIKLANNLLSCGYGALISEAYAMAKKAGADLNIFCEALPQTAANSWPLQNVFVAKAFKGDFSPYFRLSAAHKDYKLVIAMADALGTPSHAARAVLDYYTAAAAAGHGDRDFGAIALVNNPELLGE